MGFIDAMLREDLSAPRKQTSTAKPIVHQLAISDDRRHHQPPPTMPRSPRDQPVIFRNIQDLTGTTDLIMPMT